MVLANYIIGGVIMKILRNSLTKRICIFLLLFAFLVPASHGRINPAPVSAAVDLYLGSSLEDLAKNELLEDAVAFCIGEPLALSGGIISMIDPDDHRVVPWVDAGSNRAYAPLRYTAQAFKAEISWDAASQTIGLLWLGREVTMVVGQHSMRVNGVMQNMDAAPLLIGSRVYLPLRSLASAIGQEVYYDDGLIIIQNATSLRRLGQEGEDLISLLGFRLKPLTRLGSYNNLRLLMENSPWGYDALSLYAMWTESTTSIAPPANLAVMPGAMDGVTSNLALAQRPEAGSDAPLREEYSETNTQVAGVDEADIIKTDGQFIYTLRSNEVLIIAATPADDMQILARIPMDQGTPRELFVEDDRLVVISEYASSDFRQSMIKGRSLPSYYYYYYNPMTRMEVYDLKDIEQPELVRTVEIEGSYLSSRRIGSCYYLIANKYIDWWSIQNDYDDQAGAAQPFYCDSLNDPTPKAIPYDSIRCFPDFQNANYLMVAAFDAAGSAPADVQAYLGAGETIYVSASNLYVATEQSLPLSQPDTIAEDSYYIHSYYERGTRVFRFSLQGGTIEYVTSGVVPGTLLNQFSMDEHQGYLRLATTRHAMWWSRGSESLNQMYVLDSDLEIVGRLENVAPGEIIYSARFMGDRAFMVTFRTVDPLFVIDLKDPYKPAILGELKIPGYSDYLHPVGENYLLGFGKDAVAIPVKDSRGMILYENAYYLGMKVSLFDVTDLANPREAAMVIIGDRGTESSLLHNHKALMFNPQTGLLAFPLSEYRITDGAYFTPYGSPNYGTPYFDGLILFQVYIAAGEESLNELGRITQQTGTVHPYDGLRIDYRRMVERGIYIGKNIYTLSQAALQANDLNDYSFISSISLDK